MHLLLYLLLPDVGGRGILVGSWLHRLRVALGLKLLVRLHAIELHLIMLLLRLLLNLRRLSLLRNLLMLLIRRRLLRLLVLSVLLRLAVLPLVCRLVLVKLRLVHATAEGSALLLLLHPHRRRWLLLLLERLLMELLKPGLVSVHLLAILAGIPKRLPRRACAAITHCICRIRRWPRESRGRRRINRVRDTR